MVKKYGYFEHYCDLTLVAENNLLDNPPYLRKTKKWMLSIRKYILLNENDRRTKDFFRSYAAVRAEKRRHALEYPTTIHPFSTFAIYRERLLCIMWLFCYVTDPITWSFAAVRTVQHPLFIFQSILDCLFLMNAFITCNIGFVVPLTKEIVLSPKETFKHKFWTYLIPECIACLPLSLILKRGFHINTKKSRWIVLCYVKILRCLRVCDFMKYLNNIFHELNIREWVYTWFVIFLINLYLIFWSTCSLFFVSLIFFTYDGLPENSFLKNRAPDGKVGTYIIEPENSFHNTFITLLTTATCHFFGASQGYVPIELQIEKFLCSCIMMFGYLVCNFGTAKLLEIFGSSSISETKYEEWIYQVAEYAQSKNLPDDLRKRLKIYHDYKFHKRFFKEDVILATLSEHLRNEVILYGCRNVMEKVPLFQGMPKGIAGSIIGYMRREIYLPNDVVLKYGDPLTKMFWVSYGTLSVHYGPNAVEILHFEDGDHFGDLSITRTGGTALLTVVSLEISEIFTLYRKDVKHCTGFLKEMSDRIRKISSEKKELYATMAKMMTNEEAHNAVVADLRRGRILESDNWRRNP
ncbi:potassium/sodium hyperpolarization-activated cyclic nucleotide-gated channel 2-like [Coccinella septempunctata]|uniref:potassium/sodium hyperpolarization-activated cyclic nucleotide-gated channel 2-like n=1 Tax=Coccinella septempunctata TaxID=41139 RepID=UPI001D066C17|nr:potassium/sodium hyperpolarization-activated cyclic nucleotide-gated channel 2-like [Coccinella septempunctata]